MRNLKTEFHTIDEMLVKEIEPPIPLEVLPNHMGINLCAVDGMSWTRQKDGQLVSVTIHFIPDNDRDYAVMDGRISIPDEMRSDLGDHILFLKSGDTGRWNAYKHHVDVVQEDGGTFVKVSIDDRDASAQGDDPSAPPAPPRRKSFLERLASAAIDWLDDVAEERDAKRSRGAT